MKIKWIKKLMKYYVMTLLLSMVVILATIFFADNQLNYSYDATNLPNSFIQLFLHNLFFYVLYVVPWVNVLHYVCFIILTGVYVGLSIVNFGFLWSVQRAFHIPVEYLVLLIPIVISRNWKTSIFSSNKEKYTVFLMGIVLLSVTAYIEFFWTSR